MKSPDKSEDDQVRMLFSVAILASLFAYIQSQSFITSKLGASSFNWGLVSLSISAGFSFLFLLAIASERKYIRKNFIDDFSIRYQHKQMFYDLSVDIFGLVPYMIAYSVFTRNHGFLIGLLLLLAAWLLIKFTFFIIPFVWILWEKFRIKMDD